MNRYNNTMKREGECKPKLEAKRLGMFEDLRRTIHFVQEGYVDPCRDGAWSRGFGKSDGEYLYCNHGPLRGWEAQFRRQCATVLYWSCAQ